MGAVARAHRRRTIGSAAVCERSSPPRTRATPSPQLIAVRGTRARGALAAAPAAVGELEQREPRARELQASVEQILRDGAAELDLRQAELTVRDVGARAARGRARRRREAAVEARRRELGAVELLARSRRAPRGAVRTREEELERRADELAASHAGSTSSAACSARCGRAPGVRDDEYVALLAGDRYRLVSVAGAAPDPWRSSSSSRTATYRCLRVTTSPLPGDDRRCALLELSPMPAERLSAAATAQPSQASSSASPKNSPTTAPAASAGT